MIDPGRVQREVNILMLLFRECLKEYPSASLDWRVYITGMKEEGKNNVGSSLYSLRKCRKTKSDCEKEGKLTGEEVKK